jgi:hypothetical protein
MMSETRIFRIGRRYWTKRGSPVSGVSNSGLTATFRSTFHAFRKRLIHVALKIVAGTIFDDLVSPDNLDDLLRQTDEICGLITKLPRAGDLSGPAVLPRPTSRSWTGGTTNAILPPATVIGRPVSTTGPGTA